MIVALKEIKKFLQFFDKVGFLHIASDRVRLSPLRYIIIWAIVSFIQKKQQDILKLWYNDILLHFYLRFTFYINFTVLKAYICLYVKELRYYLTQKFLFCVKKMWMFIEPHSLRGNSCKICLGVYELTSKYNLLIKQKHDYSVINFCSLS